MGWRITSAAIIAALLFVSEQIGAGRFLGCVVTAGVVTSVLLDHCGLVGFPRHAASLSCIVGAVLVVLGVTLVALF